MGERFREFPLWGQFLVVLILLIVAWTLVQLLMARSAQNPPRRQ